MSAYYFLRLPMFLHQVIAKSVAVLIAITMLFTSTTLTSVAQPLGNMSAGMPCHSSQQLPIATDCCASANSTSFSTCHYPGIDNSSDVSISCCNDLNCHQMGSAFLAAILPSTLSFELLPTGHTFDAQSGERISNKPVIYRPPMYA